MKTMFSETDYRPLADGETYKGKFVVLNPTQFKPECQNALCQLFYASDGFGCDPKNLGGKIFGRLYDEPYTLRYQTRREYVLGVATEEAIQEWEKTYNMSRDIIRGIRAD